MTLYPKLLSSFLCTHRTCTCFPKRPLLLSLIQGSETCIGFSSFWQIINHVEHLAGEVRIISMCGDILSIHVIVHMLFALPNWCNVYANKDFWNWIWNLNLNSINGTSYHLSICPPWCLLPCFCSHWPPRYSVTCNILWTARMPRWVDKS